MKAREISLSMPLTKKEYRTLLDIFEIAHWVLYAHKVKEHPELEEYEQLEQKFLSYAKDMELENLIEYDAELKKYFVTRGYEDTSKFMDFVEEFENDSFWDELVHRLAERDLVQQEGGLENVMKLSLEERIKKESLLQEMYGKEFEKNGLNNLTVMPEALGEWILNREQ
jgi:hypothetical protein